jgi:hypothetical protein
LIPWLTIMYGTALQSKIILTVPHEFRTRTRRKKR